MVITQEVNDNKHNICVKSYYRRSYPMLNKTGGKVFNGKRYGFYGMYTSKKQAQKDADKWRQKGLNARVVDNPPYGRWEVYLHPFPSR